MTRMDAAFRASVVGRDAVQTRLLEPDPQELGDCFRGKVVSVEPGVEDVADLGLQAVAR
jgi:hypothetical protein